MYFYFLFLQKGGDLAKHYKPPKYI